MKKLKLKTLLQKRIEGNQQIIKFKSNKKIKIKIKKKVTNIFLMRVYRNLENQLKECPFKLINNQTIQLQMINLKMIFMFLIKKFKKKSKKGNQLCNKNLFSLKSKFKINIRCKMQQ